MFINTREEAAVAARIAAQHGYSVLTADKFYKRDTVNVFAPWAGHSDARAAQEDICGEINAMRARTAKRDPRIDPAIEDRAAEISTRTGERYDITLNHLLRGY